MLINEELEKQNITKFILTKESGVPQATISIEEINEAASKEHRYPFEFFKSTTCHLVKDMGDLDFIVDVLQKDQIRILYERRWYPEAFYLLAMVDYLSAENDIPLCTKYNDIRAKKLEKPIFPNGVVLSSRVTHSEKPIREAIDNAIPEFMRFNIVESEVRNIV